MARRLVRAAIRTPFLSHIGGGNCLAAPAAPLPAAVNRGHQYHAGENLRDVRGGVHHRVHRRALPPGFAKPPKAYEIVDYRPRESDTARAPRVLLTCEHASEALPRPYRWSSGDAARLLGTHWAFDPGAADCTRELARELGCLGVLSTFSRLLIDPNRPLASSTLIRSHCDGAAVELNDGIDEADRDWRLWRMYVPYHMAIGKAAEACDPTLILSIHTFTENYEGERRDFEVGVLCTSEAQERVAKKIQIQLASAYGFDTRLNEPWSGVDGFMYSADSLAVARGPGQCTAIMLEVRNDLLTDPEWRARFVSALKIICAGLGT